MHSSTIFSLLFTLALIMWLCLPPALGQRTGVGFGIGGMSYTGDMQPAYRLDQNRLAGTAFFKYNLDHPISFRLGLTAGGIKGEDDGRDILSTNRAAAFSGLVLDGMAVAEYQFFNLSQKYPPFFFSPYLFAGIGGYYISAENEQENDFRPNGFQIPFGAGLRFMLSNVWHLDLEFSPRKTYNAGIDNLFDPTSGKYAGGNPHKSDWMYYLGINLTYTIFKINCPTSPYN